MMQVGIVCVPEKRNPLSKCWEGKNRPKYSKKGCSFRLYSNLRIFSHHYHNFYCQTLLRNMFLKWRNACWSKKVAQQLLLRANCYYCFNLTAKAFKRWKFYIIRRFEFLENVKKSSLFYSKLIMASCFKKFKLRHAVFRGFKEIQNLNRQVIAVLIIKQRYLLSIKCAIGSFYQLTMDAIASQLWAYTLQRNAFFAWRLYLMYKAKRKQAYLTASTYHEDKMKMIFFHSWQSYLRGRKMKLRVMEISGQFYFNLLVSNCLDQWTRKYREKLVYDSLCKAAHIFCEKRLMRDCFKKIKSYHNYKTYIRQQEILAANSYNKSLKKKGMKALNSYRSDKKMCKLFLINGKKIGEKIMLKSSWNAWKIMMEKKEMIENSSNYEQADFHYSGREKCKSTPLHLQKINRDSGIMRRQVFPAEILEGEIIEPMKFLLATYFQNMVSYSRIGKRNSYLSRKGQTFSTEVIQPYYFQQWEIKWRKNRYSRILYEKGAATYDYSTKKQILKVWKKRWCETKNIYELENKALIHFESSIMHNYFTNWIHNVDESKKMWALGLKAIHFSEIQLKHFAMDRWKKHLVWKRKRHYDNIKSRTMHQNTLKLNMLKRWIATISIKTFHIQKAEIFMRDMRRKKMKNIVLEWKNVIEEKKYSGFLIHSFRLKHQNEIKSRVFNKWKNLVSCKKKKIFLNLNLSAYITESREKILKKSCLTYWRSAYREVTKGVMMMEKARNFYERAILRKCFGLWGDYLLIQLSKKILHEKANNFKLMKVQRLLLVWRNVYYKKKTEAANLSLAIQFWEKRKREKVFNIWRLYLDYRNRKKMSFLLAAEKHKQIIQEATISHFIKASIVKKIRQEEAFLEMYLKMNARQFQLGIKYGERWRDKVSKAKTTLQAERQQSENDGLRQANIINHIRIGAIHEGSTSLKNHPCVSFSGYKCIRTRTEPRIPNFLLSFTNPSFPKVYVP